jgi:preprotein translocase subunit SecG
MSLIQTLLLVLHMLTAVALCGFVLLQHGKGADMGAAFGSGASGSLFGAAGSANFLSRTTSVLAAVFFLSSLGLTWFAATQTGAKSVVEQGVMDKVPAPKASEVPAPPAGAAPASAPASGGVAPAPEKAAAPAGAPGAPAGSAADSKSGDVPK